MSDEPDILETRLTPHFGATIPVAPNSQEGEGEREGAGTEWLKMLVGCRACRRNQ
jgi:hypothetical protein